MNIDWKVVEASVIGTLIAGSQVVATVDASSVAVVNVCHTIAVLAAAVGAALGINYAGKVRAMKRQLADRTR